MPKQYDFDATDLYEIDLRIHRILGGPTQGSPHPMARGYSDLELRDLAWDHWERRRWHMHFNPNGLKRYEADLDHHQRYPWKSDRSVSL